MTIEAITCPNCGASEIPLGGKNAAVCPYCESAIRLPNSTEQLQEKLLQERAARAAQAQPEQENLEAIIGAAAQSLLGFSGVGRRIRGSVHRFFRNLLRTVVLLLVLIAVLALAYLYLKTWK
ncbi:MAG: hypothetical protein LBC83_07500 [Oscillospiraceae bacterium]|jgi:hypothetical protein|nr:hypothetical protein [Oscillospiraceae bacterium]